MTLFVVLGLVAVVVGVLVAVALGVRSMRAEGGEDDWDSPVGDSEFADPEDLGHSIRRGGERGRGGSAGARRPAVAGSATATDPGFDPGFRQVTPDEVPAPRAPVGPAPSVAPVASARPGRRHSQQKDQPKKRHSQRKDQPKRPARPPRLRGGDAGKDWNTTNWERVSDEDYWAELSADKPLASRTAQSAADLGPVACSEPAPRKGRESQTDANGLRTAETAEMVRSRAVGASRRSGTDREVAALPVRCSVSAPDTGRVVPATTSPQLSRQAGPGGADFTDPNLAARASTAAPTTGRPVRHAANAAPALTVPDQQNGQNGQSGAWPSAVPGQSDWPQRGHDYAAAGSGSGPYYSAPSYSAPSGYSTSSPFSVPSWSSTASDYSAPSGYSTASDYSAPSGYSTPSNYF